MSRRSEKVGNTLKKALSEIIRLNFDFKVLVSVAEVDISPDLSQARVYLSVMADHELKVSVRDNLENNKSNIKNSISDFIKLRKIPELIFILDETIEKAERIQRLIDQANISSVQE